MKEELELLLIENKYNEIKDNLEELTIEELLVVFDELDENDMAIIFRLLSKSVAAEVFMQLPVSLKLELISGLIDEETIDCIEELYLDNNEELLQEIPAGVAVKVLKKSNLDNRNGINMILKYKDESAGGIMTANFAELKENLTVKRAITVLKKEIKDYETINTCLVVNSERLLIGTIQLKDILFANPTDLIKDLVNKEVLSVKTSMDQELVAKKINKYHVNIMPVVDNEKKLVGIITINDIMGIVEDEATEDIEKMAAILPTDKPYLEVGVFETWKTRIPWLLILMLSSTITSKIIGSYESALATCAVLTAFIPMLMGSGGNAGGQSSVTVIRGLSLNEIEIKDYLKIVWKESRVAILCGVTMAILNLGKMLLIDNVSFLIAGVVSITLFLTIILAKTIGGVLPILVKRIGLDPAVMASPLITTIVDALSLIVYFTVASLVLGL